MTAGLPAKHGPCCVRVNVSARDPIRSSPAAGVRAAMHTPSARGIPPISSVPRLLPLITPIDHPGSHDQGRPSRPAVLTHCAQAGRPHLSTDPLAQSGAFMSHAGEYRYRRETRAARTRGFTLIELLMTLAIVGIVAGLSAPPVFGMLASQRIKVATYDLYSALAYARSQAIQRYEVVNIVPRDNNYANGWDIRGSSGVLRSQLELDRVAVSVPERATLAYDRYGRMVSPGRYVVRVAAPTHGSVAARCVIIDPDGRAKIQVDAKDQSNCRVD